MRAVVEPLEGNKVKLSVEVDEREFDKAVDAAYRRLGREVRIPGFRPGKVPRRLLEARLGSDGARQEALREALPDYYAQALKDAEVDAIAPPEIDVTGGQEAGPVHFDAVVEVRPHVAVPGYAGLQVAVPRPDVDDAEVCSQIERLRRNFGQLRPVSRPAAEGDHVTISVTGRQPAQEQPVYETTDELYEVGSNRIAPAVDEHLRGAREGDILQFDAPIPGGDGPPTAFRVLVKTVQEMELPEVDDAWAAEASEFDTVGELRVDLRQRLGVVKRAQAQGVLRSAVLEALTRLVEDDPPAALVDAELEDRLDNLKARLASRGATVEQYLAATQLTPESLVEEMRPAATEAVKADLALRAVAEAEGMAVADDELEAELDMLAERTGLPADQLRQRLEHADRIAAVRSDLAKDKALAWLVEHVEVVDEEGKPIDRAELEIELEPSGPSADNDTADDPAPTADTAHTADTSRSGETSQ